MNNLTPPYDQYSLSQLREEIKKRGLRACFKSSDKSEHRHLVVMLTGNDVFVAAWSPGTRAPRSDKEVLRNFLQTP